MASLTRDTTCISGQGRSFHRWNPCPMNRFRSKPFSPMPRPPNLYLGPGRTLICRPDLWLSTTSQSWWSETALLVPAGLGQDRLWKETSETVPSLFEIVGVGGSSITLEEPLWNVVQMVSHGSSFCNTKCWQISVVIWKCFSEQMKSLGEQWYCQLVHSASSSYLQQMSILTFEKNCVMRK